MVDRLAQHLQHTVTVADAGRYVLIAVGVTALVLGIAWEMSSDTPSGPPVNVLVQEGDTLWDLAIEYGPEHADPRRTVARIRQENQVEGSLIRPGDILVVPQS